MFSPGSASRDVPTGTRTLKVVLLATRAEGAYNDGYFGRIDVPLKLK